MDTTGPQHSSNFPGRLLRTQDVFKHVLRNHDVE